MSHPVDWGEHTMIYESKEMCYHIKFQKIYISNLIELAVTHNAIINVWDVVYRC